VAKQLTISNVVASAEAEAIKALFNNGYCRGYHGAKPTNAEDPPTGSTLLFTMRFAATAYASQANGVITMNALVDDPDAAAAGDTDWYRALESDGSTVIGDGTAGVTGGGFDMELPSVTIVQHQRVTCATFTHTVKKK
jgi:hypothetical protein